MVIFIGKDKSLKNEKALINFTLYYINVNNKVD